MSLLEIERLSVWFELGDETEFQAVRDVDLTLEAGDRLGLVGESGSGKTTTALALMGLLPPNAVLSGDIRLDGKSLVAGGERGMRRHRWKDIAMVFQGAMNALNPVRPVGMQIAEPIRLHSDMSRKAAAQRAAELLGLVGLPDGTADRYPFELSGGMRQRACIAMALACEPRVLIADEPTTALDVLIQADVLALLSRLTQELGLTLILVTHDLPIVGEVCDTVGVMLAGELVEHGPVEQVMRAPANAYTRMLIDATPDLYDESPLTALSEAGTQEAVAGGEVLGKLPSSITGKGLHG